MIKVENTEVYGFEAAIRGMRNPKNSWEKSDSEWCPNGTEYGACFGDSRPICPRRDTGDPMFCIGPNDLNLMKLLTKSGTDHSKFLRMIHVQVDVTAPLYWWKEADQYKVGTVTDSCSTMHKIHAKKFTLDDFSHEHLTFYEHDGELWRDFKGTLEDVVDELNFARGLFLETNDKRWWWQMIQLLPSSYNQKRTWDLNYEVLRNIYFARKDHKLDEWHTLCEWIEQLPYFKEIVIGE